jgi:hypothetical protein
MDEEEQVERLAKIVALQRVLERKIEHACNGLESAEAELQYATNEAFRSFDCELSDLRLARQERHMAALKKLVHDEQWPWAQVHAGSFVRFTSDLAAIEWLGHQSRQLLESGAARDAAEALLMDIAKLEAEKGGEKTGKR